MAPDDPRPAAFPWGVFLGASVVAGAALAALAGGAREFADLGPFGWAILLAGCAPAFGAEMAWGVPATAAALRAWIAERPRAWIAAGLAPAGFLILAGAAAGRFDPYVAAIVAVAGVAAFGALRARGDAPFGWPDAAIWMLLWIPFDLRGTYALWPGPRELAYPWWAAAITVFALLGWGGLRRHGGLDWRLLPNRQDGAATGIALGALLLLVVPVGLGIGFLHFPPRQAPAVGEVIAQFLGLVFTVALPEEVFFRGLLLRGLETATRRPGMAQAVSAVAFGLMHWNNAGATGERIAYCALATVAGAIYGWSYRRTGSLTAPVLVHALTDLVWKFVFR